MSRTMHCDLNLPFAFATLAASCFLVGCAVPDAPDSETTTETTENTSQTTDKTNETTKTTEATDAKTAADVSGCSMYASITYADRNGFGEVVCPYYANSLEVEACLEQLVTGGWETIDWTCADYSSSADHHFLWTTTYAVPYWTSGRWYRTQVWARVDGGAWGYITSDGMQG